MVLTPQRIAARAALAVAFIASLAIPIAAFAIRGPEKPETWLVTASALAVLTSVVSTWSSRRVVELQEDAQRPNPYPSFDAASRHGLMMIRVTNTGGTAAHDVGLEWDVPLVDHNGNQKGFPWKDELAPIRILLPGESIAQVIDVHHTFIKNHPDSEYTGKITFSDPHGNIVVRKFRLDGRQYSNTPTYDEEGTRTHYELQKLPDELGKIRNLLQRLVNQLNTRE